MAEETDCLPSYIAKGIALASFYYARCLDQGFGVAGDTALAKQFYSKVFLSDNICFVKYKCNINVIQV